MIQRSSLAECRDRIQEFAELNAFISLTSEAGDGPVVAVKDLIDVRATVTTGGGIILPAEPKQYDSTVVTNLRGQGCVMVGKANLHEWAFGPTSMNPHYGAVRNPHDRTRVAGGSSGGSAVAVAAGMADWAIGTDTGGSIRIPAALCGVVGLKPSPEDIPRDGVLPLSVSLDVVGPIARDVTAAFSAWRAMSGRSVPIPSVGILSEARIGIPRDWITGLDGSVGAAWSAVAVNGREIDFPPLRPMIEIALDILLYEAARWHREWIKTVPEKYGADVLAKLLQGMEISDDRYNEAITQRAIYNEAVVDAMKTVDALLLPVTRCVAPKIVDYGDSGDALTCFTRPFNLTQLPVYSLPVPGTRLPVGVQLIGKEHGLSELTSIALAFEEHWATLGLSAN